MSDRAPKLPPREYTESAPERYGRRGDRPSDDCDWTYDPEPDPPESRWHEWLSCGVLMLVMFLGFSVSNVFLFLWLTK